MNHTLPLLKKIVIAEYDINDTLIAIYDSYTDLATKLNIKKHSVYDLIKNNPTKYYVFSLFDFDNDDFWQADLDTIDYFLKEDNL